jgi:hypothetical protein
MKGMRLDRFDKPVIHNNKLLRTIYLAEPAGQQEDESQVSPARVEQFAGSRT